jgi:hypothetical protein
MFRDYMRNHPEAVSEYSALKQKIAFAKDVEIKNEYGLPKYTLLKDDFIRKILRKAGFKEPCVRYPVHYNELEYIGEMNPDFLYVVFYEGPDIVGFSSICEKSKKIEQFNVKQRRYYDYFMEKVKRIIEKA